METSNGPFTIRMMYAVSRELIDYAAELGMNWVVVTTHGHKDIVRMLLDTEDVAAEAMNVNGIRTTGGPESLPRGFESFLSSLLRYGPMYDDWQERIAVTPQNLAKIFRAKAENTARAEQMVAFIETLEDRLPRKAYRELSTCLGYTATQASSFEAAHKLFFTLWALHGDGDGPSTRDLESLLAAMRRYCGFLKVNPAR